MASSTMVGCYQVVKSLVPTPINLSNGKRFIQWLVLFTHWTNGVLCVKVYWLHTAGHSHVMNGEPCPRVEGEFKYSPLLKATKPGWVLATRALVDCVQRYRYINWNWSNSIWCTQPYSLFTEDKNIILSKHRLTSKFSNPKISSTPMDE